MLRFLTSGGSLSNRGSDIWQLVDLRSKAAEIAGGGVSVRASAFFNRVAFDTETDTEFRLGLRAYEGTTSQFPDFTFHRTL